LPGGASWIDCQRPATIPPAILYDFSARDSVKSISALAHPRRLAVADAQANDNGRIAVGFSSLCDACCIRAVNPAPLLDTNSN
jgi:hypothetical protein